MTSILAKLNKAREIKYQEPKEVKDLIRWAGDCISTLYTNRLVDIKLIAAQVAETHLGNDVTHELERCGFTVSEYNGKINNLYYEFTDDYFPGRLYLTSTGFSLNLEAKEFTGLLVKASEREAVYHAIISGIAELLFGSMLMVPGEEHCLNIKFDATVIDYYINIPANFDTTIYCTYSGEKGLVKPGWTYRN